MKLCLAKRVGAFEGVITAVHLLPWIGGLGTTQLQEPVLAAADVELECHGIQPEVVLSQRFLGRAGDERGVHDPAVRRAGQVVTSREL